jgi:hypothetical protein
MSRVPGQARRLFIWRGGGTFLAEKLPRIPSDWLVMIFAPPFRSRSGSYIDVTRGLPLADSCFDGIYARRIIEHLTPEENDRFIGELARVAAPGAVVRISTPDLEHTVRAYLTALEAARAGEPLASARHLELLLELFDQMVRDRPGGHLGDYITAGAYQAGRLRERWGDALNKIRVDRKRLHNEGSWRIDVQRWLKRRLWSDPRRSREAHAWLYDSYSLAKLLAAGGFVQPRLCEYSASAIPGWTDWKPDQSERGEYPFEPSLFMEALKPHAAAGTTR